MRLIVLACRGNILRSAVAAHLVNMYLDDHELSDRYAVVSRRTQGVALDDPVHPLFQNYFEYYPETRRILETKRHSRNTSQIPWNLLFRNYSLISPIDNKVAQWLIDHGIDLTDHKSTPIDVAVSYRASSIFAMDYKTRDTLLDLYPQYYMKIHLLSEIVGLREEYPDPERAMEGDQIIILESMIRTVSDGFHNLIRMTDESDVRFRDWENHSKKIEA